MTSNSVRYEINATLCQGSYYFSLPSEDFALDCIYFDVYQTAVMDPLDDSKLLFTFPAIDEKLIHHVTISVPKRYVINNNIGEEEKEKEKELLDYISNHLTLPDPSLYQRTVRMLRDLETPKDIEYAAGIQHMICYDMGIDLSIFTMNTTIIKYDEYLRMLEDEKCGSPLPASEEAMAALKREKYDMTFNATLLTIRRAARFVWRSSKPRWTLLLCPATIYFMEVVFLSGSSTKVDYVPCVVFLCPILSLASA
ncbi:hypothetical protein ACFE04_015938 [Oxalis oulophora]